MTNNEPKNKDMENKSLELAAERLAEICIAYIEAKRNKHKNADKKYGR